MFLVGHGLLLLVCVHMNVLLSWKPVIQVWSQHWLRHFLHTGCDKGIHRQTITGSLQEGQREGFLGLACQKRK